MKILLAEDEQQLSRVLETAMTHEGYQVDTAFDGQEAVDLAKGNAYDLMILDIMMPVKTGIEALKRNPPNRQYHPCHHARQLCQRWMTRSQGWMPVQMII